MFECGCSSEGAGLEAEVSQNAKDGDVLADNLFVFGAIYHEVGEQVEENKKKRDFKKPQ